MAHAINLMNATVNVLIELNGDIYMVAMKKDRYEAVTTAVKLSTENLIKTGKTQKELLEFLNYKGVSE